jgi:hypothetical protein
VRHDFSLRDAVAHRYFYVLRERWSFHTAKTHFRHSPEAGLMRLHVIASGNIPLPAGTEAAA